MCISTKTSKGGFSVTKIAVEQGLKPFHDALRNAGFLVSEIRSPEDAVRVQPHAIVISGMDKDFMGIMNSREAPVINVTGLTPEQAVEEVRRSLGPRE